MDSSKMDEFVANAALLAAHLKEKCEQAAASQQASAQDLQGAAIVVRRTIEEGKRELVEHAGSAVSSALSEKVLSGDPAAVKRYLAFLSAGGSTYPIELLADAGVHMTSDEPLELTIKKMNRVMDQMEELLR